MATTGLSKNQVLATPSVDEIVRALVEVVPTPVVVADDSGHYVYVNPPARAFFCRPAAECAGCRIDVDVMPPIIRDEDRKSNPLNSRHLVNTYAGFCLQKQTHK